MGKYAESIGVWKHTIGKITHKIIPKESDNIDFVDMKKKAEQNKDETILIKGISELYYNMVLRSDKTLTDEDKTELKDLISLNINQITEDLMVAYNWTTKEKLEEQKKKMEESMFETKKKSQE